MSDLDRQATGAPEPPEPQSEHFACRGCGKNTMQFEDGGWEHEANCLASKLDEITTDRDLWKKWTEETRTAGRIAVAEAQSRLDKITKIIRSRPAEPDVYECADMIELIKDEL